MNSKTTRRGFMGGIAAVAAAPALIGVGRAAGLSAGAGLRDKIDHIVVIFQENRAFDHYFGTYPTAANPAAEPMFTAAMGTPQVNGYNANPTLLTANPNTTNAIAVLNVNADKDGWGTYWTKSNGKVNGGMPADFNPKTMATFIGSGTIARRPTARRSNTGHLYFAENLEGGALFRSDGRRWEQITIGLSGKIPQGSITSGRATLVQRFR